MQVNASEVRDIRDELQTSMQQAKKIRQSIDMMERIWSENNTLSVTSILHTLLAERCGLSSDDFTKACNTWGTRV